MVLLESLLPRRFRFTPAVAIGFITFLAGKALQKFVHLADVLFLGRDDRLKDGSQLRTDTTFQCGLGKGNGAFVVRDHFP